MSIAEAVDDLLAFLRPSERRELDLHTSRLKPKARGKPAPKRWDDRARTLFPKYTTARFVDRHAQLWQWANAIEPDSSPDPFCAFWCRGGAKSTTAEMIATDLGVRGKRLYCLYVRMTQPQADKSIGNIATMLESPEIARHYPEHADRKLNKFGSSKGWRREQVRTAGGYTIDALGLDTASRGAKVDENRPDLIIFDDIDDKLDSPATTKKKRDIITTSILPAGSTNVAVLFIQNLIIPDGIASQLADGRADFLADRIVSGPFPAVVGLKYEWVTDAKTGRRKAKITAGTATWEGQSIEVCQRQMNLWGPSAFLKEAQHKVSERAEGVVLRFDANRHYVDMTDDEVREAIKFGAVFGGIDFGAWRFGFVLFLVDREGMVTRIDELFSQPSLSSEEEAGDDEDSDLPKNSLTVRARLIHEMLEFYGIVDRMVPIWGDAANPQDILEINMAFRRGWKDDTGRTVTSKIRVVAVMNENKSRKVGVERMNNALDHNYLRFRRDVGVNPAHEWRLGMNAGSRGTEMTGSRLIYEVENWSFVVPKEGEAQDQNPVDDTADGADLLAAGRYALMSHWRAAKTARDFGHYPEDKGKPIDYRKGKFTEIPHAVDELPIAGGGRARGAFGAPRVTMPKPRGIR